MSPSHENGCQLPTVRRHPTLSYAHDSTNPTRRCHAGQKLIIRPLLWWGWVIFVGEKDEEDSSFRRKSPFFCVQMFVALFLGPLIPVKATGICGYLQSLLPFPGIPSPPQKNRILLTRSKNRSSRPRNVLRTGIIFFLYDADFSFLK